MGLAITFLYPVVVASSLVELAGIITLVGFIIGIYNHFECHHEGCHRRGRFPHGHYKLCRIHHPLVPNDGKINQEHIDKVVTADAMTEEIHHLAHTGEVHSRVTERRNSGK